MARVPDTTIARYYGSRAAYLASVQRSLDAATAKESSSTGKEKSDAAKAVADLQKQKSDNA